jgi:hypothetical protein
VPVEVVYAYDPIYGVPASNIDATFRNAYASTRMSASSVSTAASSCWISPKRSHEP